MRSRVETEENKEKKTKNKKQGEFFGEKSPT